jgi:hypothetical protein
MDLMNSFTQMASSKLFCRLSASLFFGNSYSISTEAVQAKKAAIQKSVSVSQFDTYWQGTALLKALDGTSSFVKIKPIQPEEALDDAVTVDQWYEKDPQGGPSYNENQKWRDWWTDTILSPPKNWKTFKLLSPQNVILGVMTLIKQFNDTHDGQPHTWLKGIRIAPKCNSMMTQTSEYKGVGGALVAHGVVQSVENEDEGLGLNSTLGAEGFYVNLQMLAVPAKDGIRTSFYATGEEEQAAVLKKEFAKYEALQAAKTQSAL